MAEPKLPDFIPKWPEFCTQRIEDDRLEENGYYIRGLTDTGRPGSPIFSVSVTGWAKAPMSDVEIHEILQRRFTKAYEKAHPNGCPEGGH